MGAFVCFGSYLAEWGKPRAIRDVLKNTTQIVEGVRSLYAAQLEDQRLTNQLRLAVLETRLAKHQEAYTLWNELFWASNDSSKVIPVVQKCQDWWYKNSLYLSKEAREAFFRAYHAAVNHANLYKTQTRDAATIESIRKSYETIERAGSVIVESISLPPIPKADTERDKPGEKADQKSSTSV